jgi:hypothetical protein
MVTAYSKIAFPDYFSKCLKLDSHASVAPIEQIVNNRKSGKWRMPDLQRNPDTWSSEQASKLIISIIEGRATHNTITLNKVTTNGIVYYEIIDGGHRIVTLVSFMNDEIEVTEQLENGEIVSFKYSDMDDEAKDHFYYKQFATATYTNLSEPNKAKIFAELNSGKVVSTGEYINSKIMLEDHYYIRLISKFFYENEKRRQIFEKVTRTNTMVLGHLPILLLMYGNIFFSNEKKKQETECPTARDKVDKRLDLLSSFRMQDHQKQWKGIEKRMSKNLECFYWMLESNQTSPINKYDIMSMNLLLCECPDTSTEDMVRFLRKTRSSDDLKRRWMLKNDRINNEARDKTNPCKIHKIRTRVEIAKNWFAENPYHVHT